jgi:hypothetical protein
MSDYVRLNQVSSCIMLSQFNSICFRSVQVRSGYFRLVQDISGYFRLVDDMLGQVRSVNCSYFRLGLVISGFSGKVRLGQCSSC